jgi:hypothetical protein
VKWILFLMFFSTPAANVTGDDATCVKRQDVGEIQQIVDCRPKFEAKHVWSLQTTSQMEFSDFVGCFGRVDQFIVDTNVASTMTMRAWCMCDDHPGNKCPQDSDPKISQFIDDLRKCETGGNKPSCRAWVSKEVSDYIEGISPAHAEEKPAELFPPGPARPARAPAVQTEAEQPKEGTFSSSIRAYPRPPTNTTAAQPENNKKK